MNRQRRSQFQRSVVLSLVLLFVVSMVSPVHAIIPDTDNTAQKETKITVGKPKPEKIHEDLFTQMKQFSANEQMEVVVLLEDEPELDSIRFDREAVVHALRQTATESQKVASRVIEEADDEVLNTFWLSNMILAKVKAQTLERLSGVSNVSQLIPNFEVSAPDPMPTNDDLSTAILEDHTWGINKIEAHRVWEELGIDGSGVRVATLDTGVAINHPDLAGKMWTDDPNDPHYPGGWMEFNSSGHPVASEPHDSGTHGTHVSGTIQGGNESGVAIGVAPQATMMHGLVLPGGSGSFTQVTAGMEWAVDPYDAGGNPAGEPADVVNMSLGATGFYDEMIAPMRNMYFAGIFPAISIGNSGQGSSGSPGNVYEAVGVGATDINDNVASFSSGELVRRNQWGNPPEDWPDEYVKPDVSAPGVNVWSADPNGNYRYASGTSMAAPHLAGTAALMLSAAPDLTVDNMLQILQDTAFWDDRYGQEKPNIRFGWGRINAYEAVSMVAYESGIQGTVVDANTGEPLSQASIQIAETGTKLVTEEDGTFMARLAPGTYQLTASRFGYNENTEAGIDVEDGQFTKVNIALEALPTGSITGTVAYEMTESGIPGATVKVLDVPIDISGESDVDGNYTIDGIPEGMYELQASAPGLPPSSTVEVTVKADETATVDFTISAPAKVAVLGDFTRNPLTEFLTEAGYDAEAHTWGSLGDPAEYSVIVVNRPGNPGESNFLDFISATDNAGTGVVFLDTWSTSGNGVWLLNEYLNNPAERTTGFSTSIDNLYYEVIKEHPVLKGFETGDLIVHDEVTSWKDFAWFDKYEGEGRQVIAYAGRGDQGVLGPGIGVQERGNNRHVLLSMHGNSTYTDASDWTEETATVFLNAIDWVSPDLDEDAPRFALWDLSVSPDQILHYEEVSISAGIKNIGGLYGEYDVELRVDGVVEESTTVTLEAGAYTHVEFNVNRFDVGTYTIQIGHLTDSFEVRPPQVSIEAYAMQDAKEANEPLAEATVEIIWGDEIITVGQTDDEGHMTFDSIGSIEEYTLIVRRDAGEHGGHQYFLTEAVTVEDDMTIRFAPDINTHVQVDIELDAVHDRHDATIFISGPDTMPWGFAVQPGSLVANPHTYATTHVHQINDLASQWVYQSDLTKIDWSKSGTYSYTFGGEHTVQLEDIRGQEAPDVTLNWEVTDAYGHPVALIGEFGPQPFNTGATVHMEKLTAQLADQAERIYEPILRQYDPNDVEVRSGSVNWSEQPFEFSMEPDPILPGPYRHMMELNTGPYSGNISGEASMVLPAQQFTTETVTPGDDFQVTVHFDAPQEALDAVSLSAQLPEGFTVVDWSSSPNVVKKDYDDGTWTWNKKGRSHYKPGQLIEITYTVKVDKNLQAGEYHISGKIIDHATDIERAVAGQKTINIATE